MYAKHTLEQKTYTLKESLNIISLLEMAKMLYEDTDKSFANQLEANSGSTITVSDGN